MKTSTSRGRRGGASGAARADLCARSCEYPGCRVTERHDRMVRSDDGAWYCPAHGLLAAARALVALYQVPGDADWAGICAVIAEDLPAIIAKLESAERT